MFVKFGKNDNIICGFKKDSKETAQVLPLQDNYLCYLRLLS